MSTSRLATIALLVILMSISQTNAAYWKPDAEDLPDKDDEEDKIPIDPVLDIDPKFLYPFKIDDPNKYPEDYWHKPLPS